MDITERPRRHWPKLLWTSLIVALLLLLAAGLPAARVDPAPAPWPQAGSDIVPDRNVVWRVLPNGMRVALLPNRTPAGVVAMRLSVSFGSLDESEAERGLAHLIEHMAFNGTTHLGEGELVARLERLGLAFGADTNATTSRSFTTYALDLPGNAPATISESLFLLREIASEATFQSDALTREKAVVLAEHRKGDTLENRRNDAELDFLIPGAYAARRAPIGEPAIIAAASADQLRSLYDRFYRPERATLIIAGDFDSEAVGEEVTKRFGDWRGRGEAGQRPVIPYTPPPRAAAAQSFEARSGGDAISVFALSPYAAAADTWASRDDDMLLSIAVGAINRRLTMRANAVDAPLRAGALVWSDLLQSASVANGSIAVTPDAWKPGLEALEQEWRRARLHGFTDDEIARQADVIAGALGRVVARQDTRSSTDLVQSLLASLQQGSVYSDPQAMRDRFDRLRQTLTVEEVNEAFARRFAIDAPLIVMFSSTSRPGIEAELVATWEASASMPVTPPARQSTKVFAYTDFGPAGQVIREEQRPDLGARLIVFDNNVRLNLKPTALQKDQVLVSLRVGQGAVGLEGAPYGLTRLMSAYAAGGLEEHSGDELERIFAGHALQAAFGAGQDAFGAVYATSRADLKVQLQLAAAYLLHPGYRPEAERAWRQSVELAWPASDSTAQATFANRATRMLAGGDMRFGASPDDGVAERSFAQLRSYLALALRDAPIEIAIVGDIDEPAAIAAVAETFGALAGRRADPHPVQSRQPVVFTRGPIVLRHKGEATQALVKLYWSVDIDPVASPGEARTLSMLAAVLRLKLTATLREDLGASYAPTAGFSYSLVYPGLNYLYAEAEVRPQDVDIVVHVLETIVAELAGGGVCADDLDRARAPALDQLSQHASANGYWLAVLAEAQGAPDKYRLLNLVDAEADLRAITVEGVEAAAAKWMAQARAIRVEILPEERLAPGPAPPPA